MMRAWPILLILPLAGCLGGHEVDTASARDAFDVSQAAVDTRYDYSLFLGITGTEGSLDWQRYEADLRSQGGQAARIADAFDQDVPNGAFADGRLGAWMTTHFAYDEERRLIGGLFTQVHADGERQALFAPFTGPYTGTTAFAQAPARLGVLDAIGAMERAQAAQAQESVLCALVTTVADWHLSSEEAAKAALRTTTLQDHMQTFPDGELTYYYFPGLTVEDGCPATLDAPSNYWTVFHTDLDAYLDTTTPMPTVARIRIDADSGAVLAATVEPLAIRPPLLIDDDITAVDPLVPQGPATVGFSFDVEAGASIIDLQAFRREKPSQVVDAETRLVHPDGRVVASHAFDSPLHQYTIDDPTAGSWRFEYEYNSMTPLGEHVVELHGAVLYA